MSPTEGPFPSYASAPKNGPNVKFGPLACCTRIHQSIVIKPDVGNPVTGTPQRSSDPAPRFTCTAWLPACTTDVSTVAVLNCGPAVRCHVPFGVAGVCPSNRPVPLNVVVK